MRRLSYFWRGTSYRLSLLRVARDVQQTISRYLLLVTLINIGLGLAVALTMWLIGIPNPLLWGAAATLLNYIPYFGPAVNLVLVGMVSALTFSNPGQIALAPLSLLMLNLLEGQFVQPLFVGRMFTINPIIIFIFILFWGWLWGVAGIFMAVPILVIIKIILDHNIAHAEEAEEEAALQQELG
ncbi:MAG: AI-2E family transporter [Thiolinea sp.]